MWDSQHTKGRLIRTGVLVFLVAVFVFCYRWFVIGREIAPGIFKITSTHFRIESQRMTPKPLENVASLLESVHLVPNMVEKSGRFVFSGFKVMSIEEHSLFRVLGIQEGDVIETVNDVEFNAAGKALDAFQKFRSAPHVVVKLRRDNQPLEMQYYIQ